MLKLTSHQKGFTLIDLMIVIFIIGVLYSIVAPGYSSYSNADKTSQARVFANEYTKNVLEYYDRTGVLPHSNKELGLPDPKKITGPYVSSLTVRDGIITANLQGVKYKNNAYIKLSPSITKDNPTDHITWILEGENE